VGQDATVHEQIAEVGGGPPVRQGLDGVVCERHCSGGQVAQQGRDLWVAEPDESALRAVQTHQELVQRDRLRADVAGAVVQEDGELVGEGAAFAEPSAEE
jgi:hypothetical protein